MKLDRVENLLRERIGLDPTVAGDPFLQRAVKSRLGSLGYAASDYERYTELVAKDDSEVKNLIEEVVVSESWFFRDEVPFAFLSEIVRDGWLARPERPNLKILSLPCSCGEEPYSIAILLTQLGLPASRFRIDGIDISRTALEKAGKGLYTENVFRTKDLGFRDAFFERRGTSYQLNDSIRSLVRFHQGNILSDAPINPSLELKYDIIFCRNVLIYFDWAGRSKAMRNLTNLLSDDGTLFVGHAEGIGIVGDDYKGVGGRGTFAFRHEPKETNARTDRLRPLPSGALVDRKPPSSLPSSPVAAKVPVPGLPAQPHPPEKTVIRRVDKPVMLQDASDLADQGRLNEAAQVCQGIIARNGATPEAYFLLGVVKQALGDRAEAERCFERVVYLDGHHEEALLALVLLAERRGDAKGADNFRRRVGRLHKGAAT